MSSGRVRWRSRRSLCRIGIERRRKKKKGLISRDVVIVDEIGVECGIEMGSLDDDCLAAFEAFVDIGHESRFDCFAFFLKAVEILFFGIEFAEPDRLFQFVDDMAHQFKDHIGLENIWHIETFGELSGQSALASASGPKQEDQEGNPFVMKSGHHFEAIHIFSTVSVGLHHVEEMRLHIGL